MKDNVRRLRIDANPRWRRVLHQTTSGSWVRRAEAARMLGQTQEEDGMGSLMKLLQDAREEVRIVASYSLAEMGKEEGFRIILAAAADGRLGYGSELTLVLTMIAEACPALAWPLLDHPDKAVQVAALKALINSGRRELAPLLLGVLSREDPTLQAIAARGLGCLRYGEARGSLRRLLGDESWEVKAGAAWALRELRAAGEERPKKRRRL